MKSVISPLWDWDLSAITSHLAAFIFVTANKEGINRGVVPWSFLPLWIPPRFCSSSGKWPEHSWEPGHKTSRQTSILLRSEVTNVWPQRRICCFCNMFSQWIAHLRNCAFFFFFYLHLNLICQQNRLLKSISVFYHPPLSWHESFLSAVIVMFISMDPKWCSTRFITCIVSHYLINKKSGYGNGGSEE